MEPEPGARKRSDDVLQLRLGAPQRQGEIIEALGASRPTEELGAELMAEAIRRHLRRTEVIG